MEKSVLEHLRKDSKTWGKLAKLATEERMADLREIQKLRRKK